MEREIDRCVESASINILNDRDLHGGQPIRPYDVDDYVDVITEDDESIGQIALNPDRAHQPNKRNKPLFDARVRAFTMPRQSSN